MDYFGLTPSGRDIASASAAVITTYVIIGLFTWDAFSEEEREEGGKGEEKREGCGGWKEEEEEGERGKQGKREGSH